jgi:hypothetical protein
VLQRAKANNSRAGAGNRSTGQVTWDRDIRPSDATYLAEKWKSPVFIESSIWENTTMTHAEFLATQEDDCEDAFDGIHDEDVDTGVSPVTATPALQTSFPEEVGNKSGWHGKKKELTNEEEVVSAACARSGVLCAAIRLFVLCVCLRCAHSSVKVLKSISRISMCLWNVMLIPVRQDAKWQ